MDADRERFARMAERAKQPPFTPLENLLKRGDPARIEPNIDPNYVGCTCEACMGPTIDMDPRVTDRLAAMRNRKGVTVEETVTPPVPADTRTRAYLSDWANLIWTTTGSAFRNDREDSITYATDRLALISEYAGQVTITESSIVWDGNF